MVKSLLQHKTKVIFELNTLRNACHLELYVEGTGYHRAEIAQIWSEGDKPKPPGTEILIHPYQQVNLKLWTLLAKLNISRVLRQKEFTFGPWFLVICCQIMSTKHENFCQW